MMFIWLVTLRYHFANQLGIGFFVWEMLMRAEESQTVGRGIVVKVNVMAKPLRSILSSGVPHQTTASGLLCGSLSCGLWTVCEPFRWLCHSKAFHFYETNSRLPDVLDWGSGSQCLCPSSSSWCCGGWWVGLPVYDRDRPFQLSYRGYFKKLSFTL